MVLKAGVLGESVWITEANTLVDGISAYMKEALGLCLLYTAGPSERALLRNTEFVSILDTLSLRLLLCVLYGLAFSLSILNIKVTNKLWYGSGNRSDDVTQGFRQCLRSRGAELQLSPSSLVWRCIGTVWALCFFLTLVCGGKGTEFLQYSIALSIVLYGSCCNILADFSHLPCLWTTEGSVRTPAPSVHLS